MSVDELTFNVNFQTVCEMSYKIKILLTVQVSRSFFQFFSFDFFFHHRRFQTRRFDRSKSIKREYYSFAKIIDFRDANKRQSIRESSIY